MYEKKKFEKGQFEDLADKFGGTCERIRTKKYIFIRRSSVDYKTSYLENKRKRWRGSSIWRNVETWKLYI